MRRSLSKEELMRPEINYDLIILVSNDLTQDRRMHRTCEALVQLGWNILLMGRNLPGSADLSFEWDAHRVKCKFNAGPLFYGELLLRFRKVLQQLQFQRLLCVDEDTLGILNIVKLKGVATYFDAHELFSEVPELEGHPLKKWIWNTWSKNAIRKVQCAYTVNESIAFLLRKKYDKEFQVVLNVPVLNEAPSFPKKKKDEIIKLIYLGVLNPDRGLDLLIDAIKSFPHLHLTIIGAGPEESRLRNRVLDATQVEFLGSKLPSEIPGLLRKYDVGVNLLSDKSKSYYYSLSNKFFDYIHAGLPVLCMDFPEYKKVNKAFPCQYTVADYSTEAIRDVLVSIDLDHFYSSRSEQTALASYAYNWRDEEKKLLSIFKPDETPGKRS